MPFLLLFYGESGMGKTRLIRRLRQIAEEEAALKGKFNTLFVDWKEAEPDLCEIRKILDQDGLTVKVLRNALEYAEVLARCPVKPVAIDTVVEMLKQAIS